jgi:pyruvate kinase
MRKTKIICTLGPSTDKDGVLRSMMLAGMNIARFNFSHGSYEEHKGRLVQLRALREELGLPVAALLDTKGPEIRLKKFKNGTENLTLGQKFTLTSREVEGTKDICSLTYKQLPQDVHPGSIIMLDDGLIQLQVDEIRDGTDIVCTVQNSGRIKDNKGINVPGSHLSMPYMSQRDKEDILFGIENDYDFIAASFVRNAEDVFEIRKILNDHNSRIRIIAKIENREGVQNIDSILAAADAVMVARGDLGVEIDFTEIPMIQKSIIEHSFRFGKPIVTATQMLDSMIENPRPTRAEITDVANAIYDGTSAIMLSGETAAGKYPVEAVRTMSAIAERTEGDGHYQAHMHRASLDEQKTISDAMAHAACTTAQDIHAAAVITVTKSGMTARLLSKYRPLMPVIACVMDDQIRRQLQLSWGVATLKMGYANSTDELIAQSVETAQTAGLIHAGETVVVTAGVPVGIAGTTNMIKVHLVGDCLCTGIGLGAQNARGRVCVCRSLDEVRAKFRPGMVLVVSETSNDMLPAMKEAAAIVAEEGGMNSHAAIAGMALGKAVIIGASSATSNLRDGALITVDCKNGTVCSTQEQAE